MHPIVTNFLQKALELLPMIVTRGIIVIVLFSFWPKLTAFIIKGYKKALRKKSVDPLLESFTSSMLKTLLYVILFFLIVGIAGVKATSLVTILGTAGLAVGLALQGSLANLAGGMLILFFKPFTKEHHERTRAVIARMGLEGLEQRPIGQLSGGQLQRALLGRALVSQPQVLILDEPNTYIDKRFEKHLYELLKEINQEHAIILVSHDINTVLHNAKTVACVNHTLDYRSHTEVTEEWIEAFFNR